jgi:thiamine-phosphate pyrophosphorylase
MAGEFDGPPSGRQQPSPRAKEAWQVSEPGLPRGLYAVVDDGVRPELPLAEKARQLAQTGVQVAQLRCKRGRAREAWEAIRESVRILRDAGVVTLVNDRVDWALLSDADGVHVGDEDLRPAEARALLGPRRLVGVTVRSAAGAREAAAAGASYVGLGPVFPSRTKDVPAPPLGLERLRSEVAECPLPVVAIGGLGLDNVSEVARTGVDGVAVVSDLWVGGSLRLRIEELQRRFLLGQTGAE